MKIARQGIESRYHRDKTLEAQINLCKGWWRARSKSEVRTGFQRMANLIAKRSPQQIRELEYQKFGYYL
jgi:hypothetical protein